jgi:hypothetical protein
MVMPDILPRLRTAANPLGLNSPLREEEETVVLRSWLSLLLLGRLVCQTANRVMNRQPCIITHQPNLAMAYVRKECR